MILSGLSRYNPESTFYVTYKGTPDDDLLRSKYVTEKRFHCSHLYKTQCAELLLTILL
jgi:hypothetical protein